MENEAVRQISRDMVSIIIRAGEKGPAPVGETSTVSASEGGSERHSEFKKRYGECYKLTQNPREMYPLASVKRDAAHTLFKASQRGRLLQR